MSTDDGDGNGDVDNAGNRAGMRLMAVLGGVALLVFVLGIVGIYAISYGL